VGLALLALLLILMGAGVALWIERANVLRWTADRLLARQGLGPASFHVDRVDLRGLSAHDVALAGGAITARQLTLTFSPRQLLTGHLLEITVDGLDIALVQTKDGFTLNGRLLPGAPASGRTSALNRFSIDSLGLTDAHLSLDTAGGRYAARLAATVSLAGGTLRATGATATVSLAAAGSSPSGQLALAGNFVLSGETLEADDLSVTTASLPAPLSGPAAVRLKRLTFGHAAGGGPRLAIEEAEATVRDLPWHIEGLDGEVLWQGNMTTARFSLARLSALQNPAPVAPVKLAGTAVLAGSQLDFALTGETLTKGPASLKVEGNYALADDSGSATLALGPAPADHFPALAELAPGLQGSADLAATVRWKGASFSPDATLTLRDLALKSPNAPAVLGVVKLSVAGSFALAGPTLEGHDLEITLTASPDLRSGPATITLKKVAIERQAAGGPRLMIEQAALTAPDVPWRIEGLDGEVLWQGGKATARFSLARLSALEKPEPIAPLKLTGTVALAGARLDFALTGESVTKSPTSLKVEGSCALADDSGSATVALGPAPFKPGGLQPADLFPALAGLAPELQGSLDLAATLRWKGTSFSPDATLTLRDLALKAAPTIHGVAKLAVAGSFAPAGPTLVGEGLKITLTAPALLPNPAAIALKRLTVEPQAAGGPRVRVEQAALSAKDLAWGVQGLNGEAQWQGAKTAVKFSLARLTSLQKPALAPPLKLTGTATLSGPHLDFTVTGDSLTKTPARIQAKGRYELGADSGSATVSLAPVTFKPGGLQPGDLLPPLAGRVQDLDGTMALAGTLNWKATTVTPDLNMTLNQLGFRTPEARIQGISGAVRLTGLWPPATAGGQSLSATILAFGLPPAQLNLTGQLLAKPALKLDRIAVDIAGGEISAAGLTLDPATPDIATTLQIDHMELAEITKLIGLSGLSGSGQLDGRIPISYKAGKIAIAGGKLVSRAAGVISYKPGKLPPEIAQAGQPVQLVLQVLSDFRYDSLALELDKAESGEGTVMLRLQGRNPAVMSGHPFNFNIRIESNFDRLAQIATQSLRSAEELLYRGARRAAP
jgi:hypothetical protein